MKAAALVCSFVLLVVGCASGIHRDAECLADVTQAYLEAEQQVRTAKEPVFYIDSWEDFQALRLWQERIHRRLLTRLEERDILTETFFVLLSGGVTLALYPVVRWNLRSVLWDGQDPDSSSDPITEYCTARLEGSALAGLSVGD